MNFLIALIPMIISAQNPTDYKRSNRSPTHACISLAEKLEPACKPIFTAAAQVFKDCSEDANCLVEKKKGIELACSKLDTIENCYKSLTPVCLSKSTSDATLFKLKSECSAAEKSDKGKQSDSMFESDNMSDNSSRTAESGDASKDDARSGNVSDDSNSNGTSTETTSPREITNTASATTSTTTTSVATSTGNANAREPNSPSPASNGFSLKADLGFLLGFLSVMVV